MCELGITAENFNPRVLYAGRATTPVAAIENDHSHVHAEILHILSGECTYRINDKLYPVKKGDVIICNPGVRHTKTTEPADPIQKFYVGLDHISIKNYPKDHLIDENTCPVLNLLKYGLDFEKCCNEIIHEQEIDGPWSDLILKSLIMKLVAIILKETYLSENPEIRRSLRFDSYENNHIAATVTAFINENYMNDISLDKISKNMYMSPIYISKVFKEETGDSPINYLIKKRLIKAQELLKEEQLSIKAIAKSVGYNDAYYFSKLFKKYYGCPPSRYQR